MAQCETCGNDYDKAFAITLADSTDARTFDSFECAIQALAPTCATCGVRILGHGTEAGGTFYCCAHCAERAGHSEMRDRADSADGGGGGVSSETGTGGLSDNPTSG